MPAKVTHKKNCPKAKMFAADLGSFAAPKIEADEIEEWIDGGLRPPLAETSFPVVRTTLEVRERDDSNVRRPLHVDQRIRESPVEVAASAVSPGPMQLGRGFDLCGEQPNRLVKTRSQSLRLLGVIRDRLGKLVVGLRVEDGALH